MSFGLRQLSLFFILFLASGVSEARLKIPTGMNSEDRKTALEVLGLSSTAKVLSNPYPLGGYAGVEIGVSQEFLSTSEISRLGSRAQEQSETSYTLLSVGKGLYGNVDLFFQFAPVTDAENLTNFGGQLRWGFFEAEYLPAFMTLVLSANSVSYQNLINVSNVGYDLILGFSVEDVTMYTGIGSIQSSGIFMGGASAITDTGETVSESVKSSHFLAGLHVKIASFFVALQLDRYTEATYSGRIGWRF
jgi:hypothetical protein